MGSKGARAYRRLARPPVIGSLVAIAVLVAIPGGALGSPSVVHAAGHRPPVGFTNVSYNSSVDGFPLSFDEWLPTGYNASASYPLVVYLHGISGDNATWVPGGVTNNLYLKEGGSKINALAATAIVQNASLAGDILIAPNTRTGWGFYADSPCGGPQAQDLLDAIATEEVRHAINTSAVYLLATSMGTNGGLALAATHPGLFRSAAVGGAAFDLFEELLYLENRKGNAVVHAQNNIHAITNLGCGDHPSPTNTTMDDLMLNLSVVRFDPQAFAGLPLYVVSAGFDAETPNSARLWPYLEVNASFLSSSCLTVPAYAEPSNCTTTFAQLAAADPANYSYRLVYEPSARHGLGELPVGDIFDFFAGRAAYGNFTTTYPPTTIVPGP